ncbi:putative dienelactone hydrolase [Actinobacteria bacterium IMCC26256]|nr:putative dienelactone hydrolase [Actinobacteria bacterium IMCC26256]
MPETTIPNTTIPNTTKSGHTSIAIADSARATQPSSNRRSHLGTRAIAGASALLLVAILGACGGNSNNSSGSKATAKADAKAAGPAPDQPGPFAVGRETVTVKDPQRPERDLTVDVWYPADKSRAEGATPVNYAVIPGVEVPSRTAFSGLPVSTQGPFPLVMYSHGYGGLRFISSFLTETLASHGFVVVAPDHTGNTAIDAVTGQIAKRKQNEINRVGDVRATLDDALERNANTGDLLYKSIDPEKIGIMGHSLGGMTSIIGTVGHLGVPGYPKIKAIVGLAAYTKTIPLAELKKVKVPTMLISGTLDTTAKLKPNTVRTWNAIPARPLYRVDLIKGAHQSFSDICYYLEIAPTIKNVPQVIIDTVTKSGEGGCQPGQLAWKKANSLTETYTIAFFLDQLAGKSAYTAYLTPEYASTEPSVEFSVKTESK